VGTLRDKPDPQAAYIDIREPPDRLRPLLSAKNKADTARCQLYFFMQGIRKPVKKTLRGSVFRAWEHSVINLTRKRHKSISVNHLTDCAPCSPPEIKLIPRGVSFIFLCKATQA